MMTIRVIDNNNKKVIKEEKVDNMTYAMVVVVDRFRRIYNNVTIEEYYGKPNGKPISTIRSFH